MISLEIGNFSMNMLMANCNNNNNNFIKLNLVFLFFLFFEVALKQELHNCVFLTELI
jgi:hypothetical protein